MGGAAGVVWPQVQLEYQGEGMALIPLCENMPLGSSSKPGDVVTASHAMEK